MFHKVVIYSAFSIVISSLLHVGCVTGPETEKKTWLSRINGENYVSHPNGQPKLSLPYLAAERKHRLTKISGTIFYNSKSSSNKASIPSPLRYIKVELKKSTGKLLAGATSDANGQYLLSSIIPNGEYKIIVTSPEYFAEHLIEVIKYEYKNIHIFVKKR